MFCALTTPVRNKTTVGACFLTPIKVIFTGQGLQRVIEALAGEIARDHYVCLIWLSQYA